MSDHSNNNNVTFTGTREKRRIPPRSLILTASVAFQLTTGAALAQNLLDATVSLDMPENTSLESALIEWGSRTHATVMINTHLVAERAVKKFHCVAKASECLKLLLSNTGLSYREDGARILIIPASVLLNPALYNKSGEDAVLVASDFQPDASGVDSNSQMADKTQESDTRSSSHEKSLSEVVVTAQKREERLIDVPISIVAMDSDELQKRNITNIDDLAAAVPGLAIESSGGYSRRIEIRGVSNPVGFWSTVGLYVDEAAITSLLANQPPANTYDLDRVEVLRGPQGTLYGDGSSGGTIRLITKKPVLNSFDFRADVAAMFTQDGAPSQRIQSALNIPLVPDVLGIRVADTFEHDGGWINQPAADATNINYQDLSDVRIKALFQPSQNFSVDSMIEIHRSQHGSNTGEDVQGNYTQTFGLATSPEITEDFNVYNVTATYDAGPIRLLNTATYFDQTTNASNFGLTIPLGAPTDASQILDELLNPLDANIRSLTDELRLSSSTSGIWQWTLGGFYRHLIDTGVESLYIDFPVNGLPQPYSSVTELSSVSYSGFANTSLKLFQTFTLGAGVRVFRDKEVNMNQSPPPATEQEQTFTSTDPRAYAQFDITRDANIYASAAKGFRSGGFNNFGQPEYGPESVWTYEFGTKMSVANHRLDIDLDAFYSNYTNYQVQAFAYVNGTPVGLTGNSGNALIDGFEWDIRWAPVDNWTFVLNGDVLHTRFYRITEMNPAYFVGDGVDLVPRYGFTASAQRDFNIVGKTGFVRIDYNQQGPETDRDRQVGPYFFSKSDIIHMLNLNTSINWTQSLRLGLFAQNLTNERGYTDAFSIQNFAARPRPRTYGVSFGVSLN